MQNERTLFSSVVYLANWIVTSVVSKISARAIVTVVDQTSTSALNSWFLSRVPKTIITMKQSGRM